uniref:Variant surface glycoprotein 1125.2875 n=1 Tax=Trypanosoma brucei TaxID=5691 RepID=A0A1J0R980_9TRYP|nr:variant surface glycoprotein 1125.2875 [Trypanosoma brucei]
MTLSDTEWQKKFLKGDNQKILCSDSEHRDKQTPDCWSKHWDDWADARLFLTQPGQIQERIKKSELNKLQGAARHLARLKIEQLLDNSLTLKADADQLQDAIEKGAKEKVDDKINEAIYGVSKGKGEFERGSGGNKGAATVNACANDGAIDTKQPAAYAMMCLTLEKNSGGDDPKAVYGGQGDEDWPVGQTDVKKTYEKVEKHCIGSAPQPITPELLRSAVANIKSQRRMHSDRGYLGYTANGKCTGSQHAGSGKTDGGMTKSTGTTRTDSKDYYKYRRRSLQNSGRGESVGAGHIASTNTSST